MATAKKTAAKKAAPAAPTIDVGSHVKFIGYPEDVPVEEQLLVAECVYAVAGFSEPDPESGYAGGDPYVEVANPDFDPESAESDENPATLATVLAEGEFELTEEDVTVFEAEEEEPPAPAPAPAKKTAAKKTAAAAPAPAPAPAAKKTAKAAAAPAPAPAAPAGKKKRSVEAAAASVEETPAVDADELPDLEGEDPEVLELIAQGNLVDVAQELDADTGRTEWKLAGVLYHLKKTGEFKALAEEFAGKRGFGIFVETYFNFSYRKAMSLIGIYQAFTQAQIENPSEQLASMGWAKAAAIAPVMANPEANAADLVKLASTTALVDLSVAIKETVSTGGTKGTKGDSVSRVTLKLRLVEDDASFATNLLEAVRQQQQLPKSADPLGDALMYIMRDWAAANGIEMGGKTKAKAAPKAAPKAAAKAAPAPAPATAAKKAVKKAAA